MDANLQKLYDGTAKEYYSADKAGKKKILDQNWLHNDFTTSKKTGFGRFLSRCCLTRGIYMRNLRLAKTVEKLEKLIEKNEFFSPEEAEKAQAVRSLLKGYINKIGNKGEKAKLLDKVTKCFNKAVVDSPVTSSGSSPAPVLSKPSSPVTPEPANPVSPEPSPLATPEQPADPVVDNEVVSEGEAIAQIGEPLAPSVSLNELLCSPEARERFLTDHPDLRETVDVFVSELDANVIASEYLEDFRIPTDVIEELAELDDDERRGFVQKLSQLVFVSKETLKDLKLREINDRALGDSGVGYFALNRKLVNFMLQAIGSRLEKFRAEQGSCSDLNAQWTEEAEICLGKLVQLSSEQLFEHFNLLFPCAFRCLSKEQFSGFNWDEIHPQAIEFLVEQSKQALDCFQELPVQVAHQLILTVPSLGKHLTDDQLDGFDFSSLDGHVILEMVPEDNEARTRRLVACISANDLQELLREHYLPDHLYQYLNDDQFDELDFYGLSPDQVTRLMPEGGGERIARRFVRIPANALQALLRYDDLPAHLYQYVTDDQFNALDFSRLSPDQMTQLMPEDGGERTARRFARIPADLVQQLVRYNNLPAHLYHYVTDDQLDGFDFYGLLPDQMTQLMPEGDEEMGTRRFARIPGHRVRELILDDQLPEYLYQYVTEGQFQEMINVSWLGLDRLLKFIRIIPEDSDGARAARLFGFIRADDVTGLILEYQLPDHLYQYVTDEQFSAISWYDFEKQQIEKLMPEDDEARAARLFGLIRTGDVRSLILDDQLPDHLYRYVTDDQFGAISWYGFEKQQIAKLMPEDDEERTTRLFALIQADDVTGLILEDQLPDHLYQYVTDEQFSAISWYGFEKQQIAKLMPEDDEVRTARLFGLIKADDVLKLFLNNLLPSYLSERVTVDWVENQDFEAINADFSRLILWESSDEAKEKNKRLVTLIPSQNLQKLLEEDELTNCAYKYLNNDQFQGLDLTKLDTYIIGQLMPISDHDEEQSARNRELAALIPQDVKSQLVRDHKVPSHLSSLIS